MIKPGQLVLVGFLGQERIGLFLSYNKPVEGKILNTCDVLIDETVCLVYTGLIKAL